MIHYQLRCHAAHDFDGWFRDSAGFDQLCARGLVECPHCGSADVSRALMAPAIATRRRQRDDAPRPDAARDDSPRADGRSDSQAPSPGGGGQAPSPPGDGRAAVLPVAAAPPAVSRSAPEVLPPEPRGLPDRLRAMLQRMRSAVEQTCDYVGPEFAAEARRIHQGDIAPRGIYGEATAEEAETLAEDGIDIARIPWVPRAES